MADDDVRIDPYTGPAGGWGSAKSVAHVVLHKMSRSRGRAYSGNRTSPTASCA
jgi:hypothetical protein